MVRSDVEQYRHVGVEAVGEIDLVARQFQHIDATCGQWVLRQYGQADIPAHPRRDACIAHNMMDERRRRRLAIRAGDGDDPMLRSEEHTSELQSLMRISYAVFCLKKTKRTMNNTNNLNT